MFDYDSMKFLKAVRDVLKLPPHCKRLVIEAEAGKPLMVYVQGFVSGDAVPAIVQAVESVLVSPNGGVSVTALNSA